MLIKALTTFTAFTGEMKVFNAGTVGELPDHIAQTYIDSGQAEPATDKPQLDHDNDGKAGGSEPLGEDKIALGEARKRYFAVFGKNPGPRWGVAKIEEVIAEHEAGTNDDAGKDGDDDSEDAPDAPPAD